MHGDICLVTLNTNTESFFAHLPFSSNHPGQVDEKSSVEVVERANVEHNYNTVAPQYSTDSVQPASCLQDDECDGVHSGVG